MRSSGLPAANLEVEITERVMLEDDDRMLSALKALRERGVGIAFDDYGTAMPR